jgi:hypothetical protein
MEGINLPRYNVSQSRANGGEWPDTWAVRNAAVLAPGASIAGTALVTDEAYVGASAHIDHGEWIGGAARVENDSDHVFLYFMGLEMTAYRTAGGEAEVAVLPLRFAAADWRRHVSVLWREHCLDYDSIDSPGGASFEEFRSAVGAAISFIQCIMPSRPVVPVTRT